MNFAKLRSGLPGAERLPLRQQPQEGTIFANLVKDIRMFAIMWNFFIVGASPTEVEFAAELHNLLATDVKKHFNPPLVPMARMTLYDVASRMLGGFEKGLHSF